MARDAEKITPGDSVFLHDVETRLTPAGLELRHRQTKITVTVPLPRSAKPELPHGVARLVAGFCQHLDAALAVKP